MIQQAVSRKPVELLGNHDHVVLIDNETIEIAVPQPRSSIPWGTTAHEQTLWHC
jgi:hypothetical protein